jgi:hypothetical protein
MENYLDMYNRSFLISIDIYFNTYLYKIHCNIDISIDIYIDIFMDIYIDIYMSVFRYLNFNKIFDPSRYPYNL